MFKDISWLFARNNIPWLTSLTVARYPTSLYYFLILYRQNNWWVCPGYLICTYWHELNSFSINAWQRKGLDVCSSSCVHSVYSLSSLTPVCRFTFKQKPSHSSWPASIVSACERCHAEEAGADREPISCTVQTPSTPIGWFGNSMLCSHDVTRLIRNGRVSVSPFVDTVIRMNARFLFHCQFL